MPSKTVEWSLQLHSPQHGKLTRSRYDFQCGGAWPFLVDGVLCLVIPVSDRVLSLLKSVKHDSYLIASQRDIVCLKYAFSASLQFI